MIGYDVLGHQVEFQRRGENTRETFEVSGSFMVIHTSNQYSYASATYRSYTNPHAVICANFDRDTFVGPSSLSFGQYSPESTEG